VRITADTNVLVRLAVRDDPAQVAAAESLFRDAEVIAVTLPSLCEFGWVLARFYRLSGREIAGAIRILMGSGKVSLDRAAVEAGLTLLEAGGDFADGVIAYEGRRLGGEVFTSFDRGAVERLQAGGTQCRLLNG